MHRHLEALEVTRAVERLVNLALYIAGSRKSVTASDIREAVAGYPADADGSAYRRMLERDKESLRATGIVIDVDDVGNYRFNRSASYVNPVSLDPGETVALYTAALSLLDDPSFPFSADLRLALVKLAAGAGGAETATAALADERPAEQGALVSDLAAAIMTRKRIAFGYSDSAGVASERDAEPLGLFLHGGRWYLVGYDTAICGMRTFAVARMTRLSVNRTAPKTPDFEQPAGFDVARFISLPFQYGPETDGFIAVLGFDGSAAWKAERITHGQGTLTPDGNGNIRWEVPARSATQIARFMIENGPGLTLVAPPAAIEHLQAGMQKVVTLHG